MISTLLLSDSLRSLWESSPVRRVRALARQLDLTRRQEPLPARPLVVIAAAAGAGAAAAQLAAARVGSVTLAEPCWVLAVGSLICWWWLAWRRRWRLAAAAMIAAAALAAAAWSAARFDLFDRRDIAWQLSDTPVPLAVRGTLRESPRPLPPADGDSRRAAAIGPASRCVIAVEAIRAAEAWRPATGRATVIVRAEPAPLLVGSRVEILGRGLRPSPPLNPGEFDVAARGRADRCLSILRVDDWECVTILGRPPWWSPAAAIDQLRQRAVGVLERAIAPERQGLAAALLLGCRESLPRTQAEAFAATGLIHVLAISGLHVGLLAGGIFSALRWVLVPRRWAAVGAALAAGFYATLVGGEIPVVRATLLVWIACLATVLARRPATINSLAAAALVLVVWRPAEVCTPGSQLSFLSAAILVGIASVTCRPRKADPIERLIDRSRPAWLRHLRSLVGRAGGLAVAGAAVWLVAAPLVAARFHLVSPVALVANLPVAALVPLAMGSGIVCLLTAPWWPAVAAALAACCDAALAGIEGVVAVAAAVPAGHCWVAGPPEWWVVGWYAALVAAVVWLRRDLLPKPATWAGLAAGWAAVGLVAAGIAGLGGPGPVGLRVVAAAMGHGCGIVVTTPTGRCLVYDAGRLGAAAAAERALSAVLWSEGHTRIDTLVISHADADHFNAVPELLARFDVGQIVVSEAFLASGSSAVADLLVEAESRGVPVRPVGEADSFAIDSLCRARVLYAGQAGNARGNPPRNDNESSIVLAVETAGRRLLLTGDLEGKPLAAFAESRPGECDVLLAPHHGSRTSLPADIARATRPRLVLVSGRGGRCWPHVRDAYAEASSTVGGGAGSKVVKTGGEGAVAVTLTAAGVQAERFTAGRWRPLTSDGRSPAQPPAGCERLVRAQPAASSSNWLATYPPSSRSTPLVKP